MAEIQNKNIETSSWVDITSKLFEQLKSLLWEVFDPFEFDNGDLILSLDDEEKKQFSEALNAQPSLVKELLDNPPLTLEKIKKMIPESQKAESNTSKPENNKNVPNPNQLNDNLSTSAKVDSVTNVNSDSVTGLRNQSLERITFIKDVLKQELDLENNPNYQEYKQQAEKQLIASNPWINKDPNYQNYLDTWVLVQHQNEFLAWRPDLKASFDELTKISSTVEAFRNIRIDNYIDRNFSNTALERDKDKIKAWFLSDGSDLEIDWKEFKLWDQVQIYDESWAPKRFIERYWWRMASDARFETKYPFQFERDSIIKEHTKAKIDYRQTTDKLVWLKTDIEKLDRQISSLNPKDEGSKMQIETLQAEKKKLVEDFDKTKTKWLNQEQLIKALEWRAIDLESKEQQRVWNYRDQLNDSDEKTRWTLEFLNNIWITNISQQDFETMMSVVNSKYLTKSWFSKPFSSDNLLEKPSWDEFRYQRELISFLNKLLWLEWADAINPENVWKYVNGSDKSFTDNDFSQKVRDTLYTWWIFNTSLLETRFWWWNNEEAKK